MYLDLRPGSAASLRPDIENIDFNKFLAKYDKMCCFYVNFEPLSTHVHQGCVVSLQEHAQTFTQKQV